LDQRSAAAKDCVVRADLSRYLTRVCCAEDRGALHLVGDYLLCKDRGTGDTRSRRSALTLIGGSDPAA
jgi:hypothetical protein